MKTAFFDFDDTLTHGDTLPLWLATLHGWPWTVAAYAIAGSIGGFIPAAGVSDRRGRIKSLLLKLTVRGMPADRAAAVGTILKARVKWRDETIAAMRAHHEAGVRIVVVTGAATIYLPELLAGLPVDEVLGTELEIVDGCLTGRIAGVNCVRAAKAAKVAEWLATHRPDETWGYGNAPHDLKMLDLVDHATVI
jgi:HAD superfamily hydrolase (TIGR01490 family)